MDFVEHLKAYLSEEEIRSLLDSLKEESKHAVLLNLNKMNDETFVSLFPHVEKHPIVPHAYLYKKNEYDLGKSIYYALGCFYLQEPSAMIPSFFLPCKENELVLDMCAAPGGKSIQASLKMNNTGLIISNDLSKSRAQAIIENVERMGLGNLVITNNDLEKCYQQLESTFDHIILDAPCSGSGMFRKENKMEEDWSYNKVLKFAELQKKLLSIAYTMLKPGGTICYSTCSFSTEEDEDVIIDLLNKSDAEVIKIEDKLFYVNKKKPYGVHLLPNIFPGEGHYICLIRKPGQLLTKVSELSFDKYGFVKTYKYGNYLFGLNKEYNFKCFNVMRLGVKIGELINKDEIRYDYHYSRYVKNFKNEWKIDEASLKKYLSGETLNINLDKGLYLLKYQDINVDITNSDGRIIKNHYPKGLRKRY